MSSFQEHPAVVVAGLAYLGLVLLVGWWSAGRTRTPRDFFIAGQRLGLWVVGLGTMSAAFSGFVFVGGPGLTYRLGLGSFFIILPVGFTAGLLCWSVAGKLRRLAGAREIYTVPDVLRARFGGVAPAAAGSVAVVAGSMAYLGAQFLALGLLIEALFGVGPGTALWLGVAVVAFYSVLGGMVAGAWTDLFQGAIMLGAAVAVFSSAMGAAGGWRGVVESLLGSELFPELLEPFGSASAVTGLGFFFVFGVGVLGQPHMLHKFFMVRRIEDLRWLPLVLGGAQSLCVLVWVGIGLAVPALVAGGRMTPLVRPDEAAPRFLLEVAPELLAGLVMAGAVAAVMSTADSLLNIASGALARDLPRLVGRPIGDELLWARVATLVLALAAGVLAMVRGDLVALLGTLAFGALGAALAPVLAVGLNWGRVGRGAATASILAGLGVSFGLDLAAGLAAPPVWVARLLATGTPVAALALAVSFGVLLTVAWFHADDPAATMDPEVRRVLEL